MKSGVLKKIVKKVPAKDDIDSFEEALKKGWNLKS